MTSSSKKILLLCTMVLFVFVILIGFALVQTILAVRSLRSFHFDEANTHAALAQKITTPLSFVTFHQIPDLEVWSSALTTIQNISQIKNTARAYIPATLHMDPQSTAQAKELAQHIQNLNEEVQLISQKLPHTFLIQRVLPQALIVPTLALLNDANTFSQTFLHNQHRYLILFQNSDELRATGGFMGSYAMVSSDQGQVKEFDIQDIYEPDGQFHGFVDAPPGVKEYLSSGHGLRLPDANWSPDFPTSAKNILNFFALANQKEIEGVVAINLTVAQDLLRVTGDIYLPDYQTTVTANNIADVARADQQNFFPGSQQKRNFLSLLFAGIKIKLENLSPQQQTAFTQMLAKNIQQKNIQFFSNDPAIETLFQKYNVAGQMETHHMPSLFLVESNVGINKANSKVSRDISIQNSPTSTTISLHFINQNTDPKNDYINYQRVFLAPAVIIHSISVGNQNLAQWDENTVTTSAGETFKQIGFLVPVPHQSEQTAALTFTDPAFQNAPAVFIQKQSGLPPTQYKVERNQQLHTFILDNDMISL